MHCPFTVCPLPCLCSRRKRGAGRAWQEGEIALLLLPLASSPCRLSVRFTAVHLPAGSAERVRPAERRPGEPGQRAARGGRPVRPEAAVDREGEATHGPFTASTNSFPPNTTGLTASGSGTKEFDAFSEDSRASIAQVPPRLTAAVPMDSPYCSCKLTRVRAGRAMDSPLLQLHANPCSDPQCVEANQEETARHAAAIAEKVSEMEARTASAIEREREALQVACSCSPYG